jgi:hypothetical protein
MAETETIGTNAGFNQAVRTIATCALPPGERGSKKEHATTLKVFFFFQHSLSISLEKDEGLAKALHRLPRVPRKT